MNDDFQGVIILQSLNDLSLMDEVTVLREREVIAPPDDPYPVWSCRLVRLPASEVRGFASRLAASMKQDFYNHFVDDKSLVVVFKGRYFVLDKLNKATWGEMIRYGETVRVGPRWTQAIPVETEELL